MKVKKEILPFHNFLVNASRVGLIRPSLENALSMANLPVPLFLTFFEPFTLTSFR